MHGAPENEREYQHVPAFLARRFPSIAELEDNPIFLMESGRRYRLSRWRRLWRRLFGAGGALNGGYYAALTLAVAGVGVGTLLAYLIFSLQWLSLPLLLVVALLVTASSSGSRKSLAKRLRRDWQRGVLEHVYLSELRGRDVYWGHVAARLAKGAVVSLTIALPLIAGVAAFPAISQHGPGRAPWSVVLPLETFILVLAAQTWLVGCGSAYRQVSRELEILSMRLDERMATGCLSSIIGLLLMALAIIPGMIASGITLTILRQTELISRMLPSGTQRDWALALYFFSAALAYGAVSLPISWAIMRGYQHQGLQNANRLFERAIHQLAESGAKQPASAIFGSQ